MPSPRTIAVRQTPIELAQLLKFAGLAESGGEAKVAINEGRVLVNGSVETRKGRKLNIGDQVTYGEQTVIVSVG